MVLAEQATETELSPRVVDDVEAALLDAKIQAAADLIEPLWAKQGAVPVKHALECDWLGMRGRCALGVLLHEYGDLWNVEAVVGMSLSGLIIGFMSGDAGLDNSPGFRLGAELHQRVQPY